MTKLTIPFLLLLIIPFVLLSAQDRLVCGTVKDASSGEPLIGVSVIVKNHRTLGTVTDIDGNFEIKVQSGFNYLEFSYLGYKKKETLIKRTPMEVFLEEEVTQLEEEWVYLIEEGITLSSSLPHAPFGLGLYMNNMTLWNRLWGQSYRNNLQASYHTDFLENNEVHVNLNEFGRFKDNSLIATYDRYDISNKRMNINQYSLSSSFRLFKNYRIHNRVGLEYLNQRYARQKDHLSLVASGSYMFYGKNISLDGSVGISHRGRPQYNVGVVTSLLRKSPINIYLSSGYWIDKFKFKGELSHTFKQIRHIKLTIGYEQFLNYRNTYLSLNIPLLKAETGFWYRNLLKKDNKK